MNVSEREEIRQIFRDWKRETLLDEYVQRHHDYLPEALEELRAELRERGIDDHAIDTARANYLEGLGNHPLADEKLVVAKTYDDMVFATAGRDLLAQHSIPSMLHGSDRMLFGPGLLRVGPEPITLKVAEHDAERAARVLSEMMPQKVDVADVEPPVEVPAEPPTEAGDDVA